MSDVSDKLLQIDVSFSEAIRRGLLDTETGNYVNNVTKEQVSRHKHGGSLVLIEFYAKHTVAMQVVFLVLFRL